MNGINGKKSSNTNTRVNFSNRFQTIHLISFALPFDGDNDDSLVLCCVVLSMNGGC